MRGVRNNRGQSPAPLSPTSVVVQQHIDSIIIAKIKDGVQSLEERRIKRILVAGLGPCPRDTQPDRVPSHLFNVVWMIKMVEGGSGQAWFPMMPDARSDRVCELPMSA